MRKYEDAPVAGPGHGDENDDANGIREVLSPLLLNNGPVKSGPHRSRIGGGFIKNADSLKDSGSGKGHRDGKP